MRRSGRVGPGRSSVMRLWVDDLRIPPAGWEWAKTSAEAIRILDARVGDVEMMSLDHDFGGDDTTGAVVLCMCENGSGPAWSVYRAQTPWVSSG